MRDQFDDSDQVTSASALDGGATASPEDFRPESVAIKPKWIGVGIDIGMTYSGAAMYYEVFTGMPNFDHIPLDNSLVEHKFPSRVFIPYGTLSGAIVGRTASDVHTIAHRGKLYTLFKRDLGAAIPDVETGQPITSTTLTRLVLENIRIKVERHLEQQGLGDVKPRYTFTYPGKWAEHKLRALKEAINQAGFGECHVLEEPVAASVGAAQMEGKYNIIQPGQIVFICDLGGGTLDLAVIAPTVIEAITVKAAPGGDADLGMSNLDKLLALLLMRKGGLLASEEVNAALDQPIVAGKDLERAWDAAQQATKESQKQNTNAWWAWLLPHCEDLKRNICDHWDKQDVWPATLPNGGRFTITRDEVRPFIEAMNTAIKGAVIRYLEDLRLELSFERDHFTRAIVVGGGSRLPGIREALASLLPNAVIQHIKESEVTSLVQRGAAVHAYRPEIVLERRCGSSFGIYTWSEEPPKYPRYLERAQRRVFDGRIVTLYPTYKKLLHRHQHIPLVPIKFLLHPYEDGLDEVTIPILQGEDEDPEKNHRIGKVTLRQRKHANHRDAFWIEFELGDDGLIHVQGRDRYGQITEVVRFSPE